MKKIRIIAQLTIGIIIIAFILNKLNINDVLLILKKTDPVYFIFACFAYLGMNLVLSFRLSYLLKKIGYRAGYKSVFFSHMGGMVVGDITPGRSGYFLTPPILKNNAGVRITDGMACIFAPQGIEFVLKVGGAFAAILYISSFSNLSRDFLISSGIGAFLLLMVGILMLVISWKNESLSLRFLQRIPFFKNFTENLLFFKEKSIRIKESMNVILMLYAIGWIFAAMQWFFLGKALGLNISFFAFFLLHPLISLLMFVPLSPAGLGLMEGGVIVVFSFFGIPSAQGLAFSVLVRVSILLVDLLGLKSVLTASK
jgi:uncharacterized protein (TIRG00374 family)